MCQLNQKVNQIQKSKHLYLYIEWAPLFEFSSNNRQVTTSSSEQADLIDQREI